MTKPIIRTTRVHLTPGEIFHEQAFSVEIDDEGDGEFIVIRNDCRTLAVNPEEWPHLREVVDLMIDNLRAEK